MSFSRVTLLRFFSFFLCALPTHAQVPGAFPASTQGCDPNSTGVGYCPPPFTTYCCGLQPAVCIPYSSGGTTQPICLPVSGSAEGGQPASIPNGPVLPTTPVVPEGSGAAVTLTPPVIPGPVTTPSPPVEPGPAGTVPPVNPVPLPVSSSVPVGPAGSPVSSPLPPAPTTTTTLPVPVPTVGGPYFNSSTSPVGPGGASPSGGSGGSGSNSGNVPPFTGAAATRELGFLTGWGLAVAAGIVAGAEWTLEL